jgi:hypothetical protein
MAGLDAQDVQDGAVEALGGREVRHGDADVVEHPAEATVARMLDVRKAQVSASLLGALCTVGRNVQRLVSRGMAGALGRGDAVVTRPWRVVVQRSSREIARAACFACFAVAPICEGRGT